MERYEYKVVHLETSVWTGKAKSDYLAVLNDLGAQGWRFLHFTPKHALPSGTKQGFELVFERKMIDTSFS